MERKSITVLVMRRDKPSKATMDALGQRYPDAEIKYERIDSVDSANQLQLCRHFGAVCVVLPSEKPIPAEAIEAGYPHIRFNPETGKLERLAGMKTDWEPF